MKYLVSYYFQPCWTCVQQHVVFIVRKKHKSNSQAIPFLMSRFSSIHCSHVIFNIISLLLRVSSRLCKFFKIVHHRLHNDDTMVYKSPISFSIRWILCRLSWKNLRGWRRKTNLDHVFNKNIQLYQLTYGDYVSVFFHVAFLCLWLDLLNDPLFLLHQALL